MASCVGKGCIWHETGNIFKLKHVLWKFVEQSGSRDRGLVVISCLVVDMGLVYCQELTECLWLANF